MTYVAVANLNDLEVGDTMLVDDLREPVCLIRLDDDDVRAIHNTCTHQQQPLHEGTLQDDDTLVCAAHASRYDLTTGEAIGVFDPIISIRNELAPYGTDTWPWTSSTGRLWYTR